MKKNKLVAVAGVALAAAMMSANPQQSVANQGQKTTYESKATTTQQRRVSKKVVNEIGGIPLETYFPQYGMSPKEYGIRYGNGASRKVKTNFKKLSHQAKISKRIKSK